ncbi:MAG: 4-hydroxy-tetrahydrodipicolinate synthase [Holosporales bacterium]|jgi:4-hydroxy-tetrahydrodipicolinate synthase
MKKNNALSKKANSFYGIFVALATPFKGGEIDEEKVQAHLEFLLSEGVSGVVPCGTTGESVALSFEERGRLIRLCVDAFKGKGQVIPGTGAMTTADALAYTRQAQEAGADGALIVSPYYVKADPEGIKKYYETLAEKTSLPLILYSNPGRTGFELPVSLIRFLAESCPLIMGLKDSSADLTRPLALASLSRPFSLLSGEDATFPAFLAQGGHGIISVGANVAPALYRRLYEAWCEGDFPTFSHLGRTLYSLSETLFKTPSPGPVKYALYLQGYGGPETRLPLGPLTPEHREEIQRVLSVLEELS